MHMENTKIAKERDANACRHCGNRENLEVIQLYPGNNTASWHLSNLITICKNCLDERNVSESSMYSDRVGVLLAGGRGTRLAPLTLTQNKHMLPIGIIPMIFYPLKTLRSLGCKRILVVVDRQNSTAIMEALGSGKEWGLDITYKVQEGASGIAKALYLAKDFVKDEKEILCVLGDNVFGDIKEGISLDGNQACVVVKSVPNPEDYGVAQIENGQVIKIVEKPKSFISNLAVLGLYLYTTDVFKVIDNIQPSARGEYEISTVNDHYASINKLKYDTLNCYWIDAGSNIAKYSEANMYGAKQANVSIEEIDTFKSIVFDNK